MILLLHVCVCVCGGGGKLGGTLNVGTDKQREKRGKMRLEPGRCTEDPTLR